jgi:uncharacterized membrane protein affecting hemolysin expression
MPGLQLPVRPLPVWLLARPAVLLWLVAVLLLSGVLLQGRRLAWLGCPMLLLRRHWSCSWRARP